MNNSSRTCLHAENDEACRHNPKMVLNRTYYQGFGENLFGYDFGYCYQPIIMIEF